MAVKYNTQKALRQGGPKFQQVSDKLAENIFEKTAVMKEQVDNMLLGRLQMSQRFVRYLYNNMSHPKWFEVLSESGVGTKQQMNVYFEQMGAKLKGKGIDLDHMDMTYVNTRTALVINLLQGELAMQESGNTYIDISDTAPQSDIDRKQFLGSLRGGGKQALREVITSLQRNLALQEQLIATIDKTGTFNMATDYDIAVAELNKKKVVHIDKQKYINALDGKFIGKFRYTTSTFNQKTKGTRQLVSSLARQAAISGGAMGTGTISYPKDPLAEQEANLFVTKLQQLGPTTITGSKSLEEGLEAQLMANFLARKAKVQKDKRRTTKTKTTTHKKAQKAKQKFDVEVAKAVTAFEGVKRRGAIDKKAKRYDNDGQNTQKYLNNLRLIINAGLQGAVEKNMGRPGLESRTGTFSGSVKLETLQAPRGAKTIHGEYSYQYAPYETFENSNRWPSGYNPKPLITKSIRELAMNQMAMKFTLKKMVV